MKRTDKLTNFIAVILFLAFAVYMTAYVVRSLRSATVTAEAVTAEIKLGGVASGIVVRDEGVLTSAEKYIDVTVRDGVRVAAGTALATSMSSEQGLERANRMHALELEISRISAALQEMDSAADLTTRDESLRASVSGITSAVARHELSGIDSSLLNLRSLLFPGSSVGATQSELDRLQRELNGLAAGAEGDTAVITSDCSGIFTALLDGYESVSPALLDGLTPSSLAELISAPQGIPSGAYGKIVRSYQWYFAAVMSGEDAENLSVGRTATLNFGRYYGADIFAKVQSISPAEDGSVVVVFLCDSALSDTLGMRCVSANVVFETYNGIRIPADAVQTDPETGDSFVWCITAMQLERKAVTVLYTDEDFAIIAISAAPDALREGNTVVVSGENLTEGKVME